MRRAIPYRADPVLLTLGQGGCPKYERCFSSLPSGGRVRSALCVHPGRQVRCKEAEMAARGFALSRVVLARPQGTLCWCRGRWHQHQPAFWAGMDCTCLQLCLQIIDLSSVCRQGVLATATKIKVGECKAFARKRENSERL